MNDPVGEATGALPAVLEAKAKLTLSLRITGRRDDGYHLIDAEMVTLDLADKLELSEGDGLEIVDSPRAGALSTFTGLGISGGEDNLVNRALRFAGCSAHVRLHKRIPAGAGLGGGSADAAAVLRWAGIVDIESAVKLGADVAFCVVGGRARVTGIGEQVEPLDFAEVAGRSLTLLCPPLHVSSAQVYQAWDRLGGPAGDNGNDLEPAALAVEPGLIEWRDRLGESTGETPRLAGSGGTWFVEGAFPGEGRVVVRVTR
ncbi:MAG TPA: 4-(cytidine 5'-diphospho)-2-C-methyl-D-erythritol kinase [Acidimicrobiales bacterium]